MAEIFSRFFTAPVDFMIDYALPFVIVLSILVFVHEWGHYIVARLCGVRVETFSIGFGRELFGRTDRHGTRWKVSLIPLGGYVQMFGDVDPASTRVAEGVKEGGKVRNFTKEELKVTFFNRSVGKRSLIVFAGPAINFIFAIVLLTGLYALHGEPYKPPVAAEIMKDMPAEAAGMQPGDRVVSINGAAIQSFDDIVRFVTVNLDASMRLEILRPAGEGQAGETLFLDIKPKVIQEEDRFGFVHSSGRLGFMSIDGETEILKHSFPGAFVKACSDTWEMITGTLKAIGQMIVGTRSAEELGGVIRIGAYAGEFARSGVIALISFAALLSVNLGLINLFPVPMLDGGHLAFYAFESVNGKPMSERMQEYGLRFGMACILALMLFATWNDLVQMKVVDYFVRLVS